MQVTEKGSTVEGGAEKEEVDAEVAKAEAAAPAAAPDEADAAEVTAAAAGQQMLSPLSGAYLLVILGEPISEDHKEKMLEKLRKGMYSVCLLSSLVHISSSHLSRLVHVLPLQFEGRDEF